MSSPYAKTRSSSERESASRRKSAAIRPATPARVPPGTLQRVLSNLNTARPADILALQHSYGNRAVQHVLQAKLRVGPAGDRYEQEADRVADKVMTMPTGPATSGQVARQPGAEVQAKPLASTITPLVQRSGAHDGFETDSKVENQLQTAKGSGQPLPQTTRTFMEERFGTDFRGVRVHTDPQAAQISRQLSAQAFTHGQDIYMGADKYNPDRADGRRLLAHELTHVVQQTGGPATPMSDNGVQRNGTDETTLDPKYKTFPVAQAILDRVFDKGVVKKSDLNGGLPDRIYDSYFRTGNAQFRYVAASATKGRDVLLGTADGMCESFSDAFLMLYFFVNKAAKVLGHEGYKATKDLSLADDTFFTPKGLALIGTTGVKGNINQESNTGSDIVANGYAAVNQYLFKHHWRPSVDGQTYDPLFKLTNPNNGDLSKLHEAGSHIYSSDKGGRVFVDEAAPASPSFEAGYILIKSEAVYEARKKSIAQLYKLLQSNWLIKAIKTKSFKPEQPIARQCKALVTQIGDVKTFKKVAGAEYKTSGNSGPDIATMLTAIENGAQ